MSAVSQYFKGLFQGIGALLTGMSVTWKELFAKKVTQQYPENRKTLVMSERFRGELVMPHDENNEHACTSCGICEMNCPNGTIQIKSKMIVTEEGRKKKILDEYYYNLGMCTFCNLCVLTCPSDAIKFDNVFENALFTRDKLNMKLNQEGSQLREKKKPQPKPEVAVEKKSEAPISSEEKKETNASTKPDEVKKELPKPEVKETLPKESGSMSKENVQPEVSKPEAVDEKSKPSSIDAKPKTTGLDEKNKDDKNKKRYI